MSEKRERSANFNVEETRLLVDTALKFKSIIENKAIDANNLRDKNIAWDQITSIFNSTGRITVHRNTKTLKLKYDGLKKSLRKKIAEQKRQMYTTGGEPMNIIKIEDYEERLYSVIRLNAEGLSSRKDSDTVIIDQTSKTKKENILQSDDTMLCAQSNKVQASRTYQPAVIDVDNPEPLVTLFEVPDENKICLTMKSKKFNTNKSQVLDNKIQKDNATNNSVQLAEAKKELVALQMKILKIESENKIKTLENELTRQELNIKTMKEEHEIKLKILKKELEEKDCILKRNDEKHKSEMKLLELKIKQKEIELLSRKSP